jgi:hypothetical protein
MDENELVKYRIEEPRGVAFAGRPGRQVRNGAKLESALRRSGDIAIRSHRA